MRVLIIAPIWLAFVSNASAQSPLNCSDFQHNQDDGSWSPTHLITLTNGTIVSMIPPNWRFQTGPNSSPFVAAGFDIGSFIEQNCQ